MNPPSNAKTVHFDQSAQLGIKSCLSKISRLCSLTLGPTGKNVLVDGKLATTSYNILKQLSFEDHVEDTVCQMLKNQVRKIRSTVGDGTTTSIILTEAIYSGLVKLVSAGIDPVKLCKDIDKCHTIIDKELDKISFSVGKKEILEIALASSGLQEAQDNFSEIIDNLNSQSTIVIEESQSTGTNIEHVNGFQFQSGYVSKHLLNEKERAVLGNPLVLLYESKIGSVIELVPILEKIASAKKPLLILTSDIENEVIAFLVVNSMKRSIQSCVVKTMGSEKLRKDLLEDLGNYLGCAPILDPPTTKLQEIDINSLGKASKAVIEIDLTTIYAANPKPRLDHLIKALENPNLTLAEKEEIQNRISRISGNLVKINVGAFSEGERTAKKEAYEQAINSIRCAIKDGAVAGGGLALIAASKSIYETPVGLVMKKACSRPLYQIIKNCGIEPEAIISKITSGNEKGFDARTLNFADPVARGIIDAKSVVKLALRQAVEQAKTLISTECVITIKNGKFTEPPPGIEAISNNPL